MNCDYCETPFVRDANWHDDQTTNDDDNWGHGHEVYNDDEMQKLCTKCFDLVMAMCCRGSCDTYYADEYLEFDPKDEYYETSPLCEDCYDTLPVGFEPRPME